MSSTIPPRNRQDATWNVNNSIEYSEADRWKVSTCGERPTLLPQTNLPINCNKRIGSPVFYRESIVIVRIEPCPG
jgi:hypothetical protein